MLIEKYRLNIFSVLKILFAVMYIYFYLVSEAAYGYITAALIALSYYICVYTDEYAAERYAYVGYNPIFSQMADIVFSMSVYLCFAWNHVYPFIAVVIFLLHDVLSLFLAFSGKRAGYTQKLYIIYQTVFIFSMTGQFVSVKGSIIMLFVMVFVTFLHMADLIYTAKEEMS